MGQLCELCAQVGFLCQGR